MSTSLAFFCGEQATQRLITACDGYSGTVNTLLTYFLFGANQTLPAGQPTDRIYFQPDELYVTFCGTDTAYPTFKENLLNQFDFYRSGTIDLGDIDWYGTNLSCIAEVPHCNFDRVFMTCTGDYCNVTMQAQEALMEQIKNSTVTECIPQTNDIPVYLFAMMATMVGIGVICLIRFSTLGCTTEKTNR